MFMTRMFATKFTLLFQFWWVREFRLAFLWRLEIQWVRAYVCWRYHKSRLRLQCALRAFHGLEVSTLKRPLPISHDLLPILGVEYEQMHELLSQDLLDKRSKIQNDPNEKTYCSSQSRSHLHNTKEILFYFILISMYPCKVIFIIESSAFRIPRFHFNFPLQGYIYYRIECQLNNWISLQCPPARLYLLWNRVLLKFLDFGCIYCKCLWSLPAVRRRKTAPRSPPICMEMIRRWSSSLTQTRKVLASLWKIPRPVGQ